MKVAYKTTHSTFELAGHEGKLNCLVDCDGLLREYPRQFPRHVLLPCMIFLSGCRRGCRGRERERERERKILHGEENCV